MPEEILPDDKWTNGYRSDIEVELGMTRATTEARSREQASTDGEPRFLKPHSPERACGRTESCEKGPWQAPLEKELGGFIRGPCPWVANSQSEPHHVDHKRTGQASSDSSQ